jgi:hypothetical protein
MTSEQLIGIVQDHNSTSGDMRAAAKTFLEAAGTASRRENEEALRALGEHLNLDDAERAGIVSLVCGALVERGCDATPIAGPLIERLKSLLELSTALAEKCEARMPALEKDEDPEAALNAVRNQVAPNMVKESAAWDALEKFWPVTIAVFSTDAALRAKAKPLRDLAGRLSKRHIAGHWLKFMLSVLDNEPILVLEPETRLGIEGRISGVVDNFQLNILIMDAFPRGLFARRRVSQSAVDIVRGGGPQRGEETVVGTWNLYTWKALGVDGKLPPAKDMGADKQWIWNEGVPDDIPVFEGRRVVLLGPPSYQRSWPAQRLFNKLPGKLDVKKVLKKSEVEEWITKMTKTKKGKS